MDINAKLQQDLVTALKAKDKITVDALRGIKSALKEAAIASRASAEGPLDDSLSQERIFAIFKKQIKQRKDSATEYRAADRADLAEPEEAQAAVLSAYLPQQLTGQALRDRIQAIVADSAVKEFGPLMGVVMKEVGSEADGVEVKQVLTEVLQA